MRAALISLALLTLGLPPAIARSEFEVASIKFTDQDFRGTPVTVLPGGRFTPRGATLKFLIQFAWGLHPRLVVGGPSWIDSTRFDITAKADSSEPQTMET